MRRPHVLCDDDDVTPVERLPRTPRSADRVLTGAIAGLARRWRLDPTALRAAVAVLGLVGGLGIAIYAIAFLLSEPADTSDTTAAEGSGGSAARGRHVDPLQPSVDPRRSLAVGTATAAVLVTARSIGLWAGDEIMIGVVAAAIGVSIVWSPSHGANERSDRAWFRRPVAQTAARVLVGALLLGGGVISLANRTGGLSNVGASASAIAVVVGGLAVFGAPALGRTLRALDDERATRIRDDEMARVSAHLHDSVLQSLVLIQRSHDPREMSSLARRQERELRAWLYGDTLPGRPTTVAAAVESMATDIESDHHVRVEAVVVGDQPLDDSAVTMLSALREAVVNAARHGAVDRVDVFVEADDAELTGYVRDTGIGFDPGRTPDGHRGIEDSIVGRVRRAGGTSVIASQPGSGTEVEIRIPRDRSRR